MDLRPSAARWFELVVPKDDADDAMEALARHGSVQFEWKGDQRAAGQPDSLEEPISRSRALAAEYCHYWPPAVFEKRCCALPVEVSAQAAIHQIESWLSASEPLFERLDDVRCEQRSLGLWGPVLGSLGDQDLDLGALAAAGPVLTGGCLVLPANVEPPELTDGLEARTRFGGRIALLGLVPRENLEPLCRAAQELGGECLRFPGWFAGTPRACCAELPARMIELESGIQGLERELHHLAKARGIAHARGVLERIDWFRETARNIHCDGDFCWITGWTSENDSAELARVLGEVGIDSSIDFAEPPEDAESPSVLRNPAWLEPFEVFTHAVGVPGINEADPTTWVALLVPLMFGYMCGDVGHGAVIVLAGFLLRPRTGLWPLLVVCGLAAVGFGFVYGDVFGYEHLLDPLWVRPMDQPLMVLIVPVIFGTLVLSGGVLLHAVQTCWRGLGRSEGVADAAQLLVYWGILLAFVDLRFVWLCVSGAALCISNRLWMERSPMALLTGMGNQIESTFSLLLNTLSFARVGAFALAHAALETAVLAVADGVSTTAAAIAIVVVGNLVVIVLEGLVVSIQTTRLVLFEFFVRFFEGSGRRFQPAHRPPAVRDNEESR